MAHNKLYRSFIILQEDERGTDSAANSLAGYAKVEAKGDKCKVSFYAQNLNKENTYKMVLICSKKDCRQLIDLGRLDINESGKGETCKEYYINDIAGLGISYESISGAGICLMDNENMIFLLHGFMNGEETSENWKDYKVVKDTGISNPEPSDRKIEEVKVEKEAKITAKSSISETKISEQKQQEKPRNTEKAKEEVKEKTIEKQAVLETNPEVKDAERKSKKYKDKCGAEKEIKKIYDKLEETELNVNINIPNLKEDVVIYGFITRKDENNDCYIEKFKLDAQCSKKKELLISEMKKSRRIEENTQLDRIDFDKYEESIKNSGNDSFEIKGAEGKYFESIAQGFSKFNGSISEIEHCKWYKVDVDSMDSLCDKTNYDKYTLAYYPMQNYYPYISRENHFLLGYKCSSEGELQYIVYGIPGSRKIEDQPYGGKTGFVTWSDDGTRSGNGYWLMFYDYKKCSIVVPVE